MLKGMTANVLVLQNLLAMCCQASGTTKHPCQCVLDASMITCTGTESSSAYLHLSPVAEALAGPKHSFLTERSNVQNVQNVYTCVILLRWPVGPFQACN